MALDIHAYESGKMGQLLFQVDDKALGDLRRAFELFRQRTGLSVDPYRDLVVDAALPALVSSLTEVHASSPLCGILEECERTGRSVIFVGD